MNYCREKLRTEEIVELFKSGCKTDTKLGLEYERIPVSVKDYRSISYYGEWGICELLADFARIDNWDYILDDLNIIGLKKLHNTITIEPGCQFEISLEPQKNIKNIKAEIDRINKELTPLLKRYEIKLLNYGVTPVSTYRFIPLNPKRRYKIMANYLGGILSDVMMRETAGIQVCIDYKNEEDALRKFNLANRMSPFTTGMLSNSKIRGGVDTGYCSFRALAWLNTDNERCGFGTKFGSENLFEDYINFLMEVPMIFIQRENNIININGEINFRQFMENGYGGLSATIEDFKLHANLAFPDVRLNSFIEIRNHDSVPEDYIYSTLALYKGIMYNKSAMESAEELLERFDYEKISEFRYRVPREGLQTRLGHYKVRDIAKELVEIAYYSLREQFDREDEYLLPIKELVKQGLTPGDLITPLIEIHTHTY